MSKHELTEADLIRLIGNPLIPESIKDTYRKKLKEMQEISTGADGDNK